MTEVKRNYPFLDLDVTQSSVHDVAKEWSSQKCRRFSPAELAGSQHDISLPKLYHGLTQKYLTFFNLSHHRRHREIYVKYLDHDPHQQKLGRDLNRCWLILANTPLTNLIQLHPLFWVHFHFHFLKFQQYDVWGASKEDLLLINSGNVPLLPSPSPHTSSCTLSIVWYCKCIQAVIIFEAFCKS